MISQAAHRHLVLGKVAQLNPGQVKGAAIHIIRLSGLGAVQRACSGGQAGVRQLGGRVSRVTDVSWHDQLLVAGVFCPALLPPPLPCLLTMSHQAPSFQHPPADTSPALSATNLKKATLVPSSVM